MADRGGQPGNNNHGKGKPWREAIDRALAQSDGKKLRAIAEKTLDLAEQGEAWAVKEIGDRLDGKAAQSITGGDGNPLQIIFQSSDADL